VPIQSWLRFWCRRKRPSLPSHSPEFPWTVCATQELACLTKHYHRTPHLTAANNLSDFFFLFHKKFQIDALLDFHPSHESGRATQHGHTQTKLRGKQANTERRVQSCSIREASRSITYYSLPISTSFHCRVNAIPLFYSRTSYTKWTQSRYFIAAPLILSFLCVYF
jgi:hypothetical protein